VGTNNERQLQYARSITEFFSSGYTGPVDVTGDVILPAAGSSSYGYSIEAADGQEGKAESPIGRQPRADDLQVARPPRPEARDYDAALATLMRQITTPADNEPAALDELGAAEPDDIEVIDHKFVPEPGWQHRNANAPSRTRQARHRQYLRRKDRERLARPPRTA